MATADLGRLYTYNSNGTLHDERIWHIPGDAVITEYTYDSFNRVTESDRRADNFIYITEYDYLSNGNATSSLIGGYTSTVNGTSRNYTYTYDSKGNITSISQGGNTITYTYDDLGQLTKEVSGNTTRDYTYDDAGNITAIKNTTLSSGGQIIKALNPTLPGLITTTTTLSYTNSEWGDLLTKYNGTTITYDEIGNPISYYNGSAYTFSWTGRQLTGAVKGSTNMSFTYDDNGIRTSKTIGNVTHNYYLNGSQIVAEQWSDKLLVYLYDASGAPIGMMYRTTSYAVDQWDVFWFEKNLQGDIVAVYNESGTKVATYTYSDAWGNHTASYTNGGGSTGAQYNPFRYRSYYYDTDLGMYYLQSRYYDPNTCRFINADGYVSTGQGLTGYNMFAYCNNNPVNYVDPYGDVSLLTLLVVSTFAFSILALIPLSIMDGLSYEDSQRDALFSETFGQTKAEFVFYEIEVNDVTLWNKSVATSLGANVGVSSFTEKYGYFTADASKLTAEASVDLVGGSAGAYLCGMGISRDITLFGKKINVGIELNCGAGIDFSIGPETEIGLCVGVGPSLKIDWDP